MNFRYKVIFIDRNVIEVLQLQQRMLIRNGKNIQEDILPFGLLEQYKSTLEQVKVWTQKQPNVEIHFVNYADNVQNPFMAFIWVNDFLKGKLTPEKMGKIVEKRLHHEKASLV